MKDSAYKFWKAVVAVLTVIQWGLLLSAIPCMVIVDVMRETGWAPGWAPVFLRKGCIPSCIPSLEGAFIVWMLKRCLDIYVVTPLWFKTSEYKELRERLTNRF